MAQKCLILNTKFRNARKKCIYIYLQSISQTRAYEFQGNCVEDNAIFSDNFTKLSIENKITTFYLPQKPLSSVLWNFYQYDEYCIPSKIPTKKPQGLARVITNFFIAK